MRRLASSSAFFLLLIRQHTAHYSSLVATGNNVRYCNKYGIAKARTMHAPLEPGSDVNGGGIVFTVAKPFSVFVNLVRCGGQR